MRKTVFLIMLAFLLTQAFPGQARAADYSLGELFDIAIERAERVKLSEEELYVAERNVDRATGALYPKLSALADYRKYTESESVAGRVVQPSSSSSWGARLDQSLSLSGREFVALGAAKDLVTKASSDLRAVKEGYLFNVAAGYYDVLRAKKGLDAAKTNFERLTGHRDAAESRLRVGEATKTVLLRAEAELAAAKSELVKAENALLISKAVLAGAVGIDGDFGIKEDDNGTTVPPGGCNIEATDSLSCLKNIALSERAELKSLGLLDDIASSQSKIAKGAYWPTLSIEGVYLNMDADPDTAIAVDETMYGGLRLTFLFFDGGLRKADIRQARARKRQAGLALEEAKRNIGVAVESAYLALISQRELWDSSKRQTAFAKENYSMVSRQFELGLSSNLDVMDANTLLLNSETQLINSELGYRLAALKLARETGTLLGNIEGSTRRNR